MKVDTVIIHILGNIPRRNVLHDDDWRILDRTKFENDSSIPYEVIPALHNNYRDSRTMGGGCMDFCPNWKWCWKVADIQNFTAMLKACRLFVLRTNHTNLVFIIV